MTHSASSGGRATASSRSEPAESDRRVLADGGPESADEGDDVAPGSGKTPADEGSEDGSTDGDADDANERKGANDAEKETERSSVERSNVDVMEAGEAEPADAKWEKPDVDESAFEKPDVDESAFEKPDVDESAFEKPDVDESAFEKPNPEDVPPVEGPKTRPAPSKGDGDRASADRQDGEPPGPTGPDGAGGDVTPGMPNTARAPGQSRLDADATEGYVVALEFCAELPNDVRLPEEAADVVPVALEAELEQDVQSFAADAFDNPTPHVETLDFVERGDALWLRLRLGVDPETFEDLDPDAVRAHALQRFDDLL